jgi:hypothetical protein
MMMMKNRDKTLKTVLWTPECWERTATVSRSWSDGYEDV